VFSIELATFAKERARAVQENVDAAMGLALDVPCVFIAPGAKERVKLASDEK